jgi:hypothetical protein
MVSKLVLYSALGVVSTTVLGLACPNRTCSKAESREELPLTTTEVDHPARSAALQRGQDRAQALLSEADAFLDRFLFPISPILRLVFFHKPEEGFAGEAALVLEVALGVQSPLRVPGEPLVAATQQLFYFFVSNPVVLVVVQNRDENVEVPQEIP